MLTAKEIKPQVWEITLEGVVERSDIQTMERALAPALEGDRPLGLILRAEGWSDITADAMAEDARFEMEQFARWSNIAKMAMVSDLQAFAALMKWIDPLLPTIEMRSFPSTEVAAAERFASDLPEASDVSGDGGIRLLSDGSDGVLAYEIDGRITQADVDRVLAPLETQMAGDARINLLVRFKDFDGFDPAILTNGTLLGTKMSAITHLRRYAVIGAPGWMRSLAATFAAVMPFEMKMFDSADDAAAWEWVRAS